MSVTTTELRRLLAEYDADGRKQPWERLAKAAILALPELLDRLDRLEEIAGAAQRIAAADDPDTPDGSWDELWGALHGALARLHGRDGT